MPSPTPEALALGRSYRLALLEAPRRGLAGSTLGAGPGSSQEFHDRRVYAAGDDVRHLDWRAFARTDQLLVRLHTEEIAPELDILVDASASMGIESAKAQMAVDLTQLLCSSARVAGFRVRILRLADEPQLIPLERFEAEGLELTDRTPLGHALAACTPLLRPGTVRILVSDLLSPADAGGSVRDLAVRSGGLAIVQLLGPGDARPAVGEALRLVDAEDGSVLDLVLDRRTVDAYRQRLTRLQGAWSEAARRRGGTFASLVADESLEAAARGPLLQAGLLEPA